MEAEVLNTVTSAPKATPNFTAICPNPPNPSTASLCPLPTFQWRSGEYVVMPAHNNGATAGNESLSEMCNTKSSCTTILSEYPP